MSSVPAGASIHRHRHQAENRLFVSFSFLSVGQHTEPADSAMPTKRWRLYMFKKDRSSLSSAAFQEPDSQFLGALSTRTVARRVVYKGALNCLVFVLAAGSGGDV